MAVEVTAIAARLRADAGHGADAHWIDLKMVDRTGNIEIALFLTGPRAREMADAYAAAINMVDNAFNGLKEVLKKHAEPV